MQKLQETQERLFAEIKELISKIYLSNEEDFIAEVGVFTELEKVISLKIIQRCFLLFVPKKM